MPILIKDIKGLIGAWESEDSVPQCLKGSEMSELPVLENAWLAIDGNQVLDFGLMKDFPGILDWRDLEVVDAAQRFVWPAWCDSHTHLVFAHDRGGEFMDRLNGLSYQEIAARGGGILNSAKALQSTTEEDLLASAMVRLKQVQWTGTCAIEIKSGYGLTPNAELKMLRVIRRLAALEDLSIKSTFLAAHAIPSGLTAAEWLDISLQEILPQVVAEGLADFIDVFCEQGYFDLAETEAVMRAGRTHGLPAKIHVNQFNAMGGVELALGLGALSLDHLEELSAIDLQAFSESLNRGETTFVTALPGCSHFLGIPYAPGRQLIDAGLPLTLATDFNPGSAPSGNMTLAVQLAIVKMKLRPLEAIAAATLNGAAAMKLGGQEGAIVPGRKANLILSKPMSSLVDLGYRFGEDPVENVLINGRWIRD